MHIVCSRFVGNCSMTIWYFHTIARASISILKCLQFFVHVYKSTIWSFIVEVCCQSCFSVWCKTDRIWATVGKPPWPRFGPLCIQTCIYWVQQLSERLGPCNSNRKINGNRLDLLFSCADYFWTWQRVHEWLKDKIDRTEFVINEVIRIYQKRNCQYIMRPSKVSNRIDVAV